MAKPNIFKSLFRTQHEDVEYFGEALKPPAEQEATAIFILGDDVRKTSYVINEYMKAKHPKTRINIVKKVHFIGGEIKSITWGTDLIVITMESTDNWRHMSIHVPSRFHEEMKEVAEEFFPGMKITIK